MVVVSVRCLVVQVFARASKYSLFDPAKEMVYIEMDADEKKQGKAAVDLVGSQVGLVGRWRAPPAVFTLQGCLAPCAVCMLMRGCF